MRLWYVVQALSAVSLLACGESSEPPGKHDSGNDAGSAGAAAGAGTGGRAGSAGSAGAAPGGAAGTMGAGAGGAGTGSGGTAGTGGTGNAGGGTGGGTSGTGGVMEWDWPTYEEATASARSTRLLVVLLDFSDSNMSDLFENPEGGWSDLLFGTNQGQGNHYWYQTSIGQFQLLKAAEQNGTADNGVISVKLSSPRPTTGTYVVQDQTWIPEALDLAAADVDFDAFDTNDDGILQNTELSVMFVLNIEYAELSGAGAEANIDILHPIAGTNVVLEKFTRVLYYFTSIGTPLHELGHHILDLDHGPAPSEHDLMGLGAYAEDPVLSVLHNELDHYATRPAGLHGLNKIAAGFAEATRITETTRGVQLYAPETGKAYNVLELAVQDGFLYLENRTAWGYDQSIPFCEDDTGGIFAIDASQYLSPLNLPGITRYAPLESYDLPNELFCDYYAFGQQNAPFSFGPWTIENVSPPGPVITLDIVKRDVTPTIEKYKYEYWVTNPAKEGYRMWHWQEAKPGATTRIDFSTFPSGDDATGYFTISLNALYSTGEVRSVNTKTTYTSDTPYLTLVPGSTFTNPGAHLEDTIVRIILNTAETYSPTATVSVVAGDFATTLVFENIPAP